MIINRAAICVCGDWVLYNDLHIHDEDENDYYVHYNIYRWVRPRPRFVRVLVSVKK